MNALQQETGSVIDTRRGNSAVAQRRTRFPQQRVRGIELIDNTAVECSASRDVSNLPEFADAVVLVLEFDSNAAGARGICDGLELPFSCACVVVGVFRQARSSIDRRRFCTEAPQ